MKKRLSKALAAAGIASRRKCDELIEKGQVRVNGTVIREPFFPIAWESDKIEVSGKKVRGEEKKVYFLVNKPAGYYCTSKREHPNRRLVIDLLGHLPYRLFTAGRLDKETTGLLIVTNDGEFAQKVIHPSRGVRKEYVAKTAHEITDSHLKLISQGMRISGDFVRPITVKKVRRGTVKIVISEGKKHEVRLLLEQAGLTVLDLCRVRIGSLTLGKLPLGDYRELSSTEISELTKETDSFSSE